MHGLFTALYFNTILEASLQNSLPTDYIAIIANKRMVA